MSKIQVKVEELNALKATEIVEYAKVEQRFIQMYEDIHGKGRGVSAYQKEAFNFKKVLRENPEVANCSRMSLFGCFLDMAVNGLSLDPTGRPHCYLIPRNVKTGHKDAGGKEIYEKRASVSVTGYGELIMRQRAGQIKYVDDPVIVYEGDIFNISLDHGRKQITYSASIPRKSNKAIAAFIRIVRNDGSEDYQWLLEADVRRLKGYSERANRRWDKEKKQFVNGQANELYTSQEGGIDAGFFESKIIKHAFDAYPKVRIGKYTDLETQEEPQGEVDYGIEDAEAQEVKETPVAFGEEETPVQPEPAGVVVELAPEDEYAGF
jgi:recombinational DNA repair protein RecT